MMELEERLAVLREAWERHWFRPGSAANLGYCRLLSLSILLALYLAEDLSAWASVPSLFWIPIPLFRWMEHPALPLGIYRALEWTWKLSLLTGALGLCTRVSCIAAFVLGTFLLGVPQNFGQIDHANAFVPLVLLILAVSRCGDACSIDRWWRRRRAGGSTGPASEYGWPVRAVWLVWSLVFFAAGVSKLRNGGLTWVTSDNMANILLLHHYGFRPSTDWGLTLARYPLVYKPMAACAMAFELLSPMALVSSVARWILVPAIFLMVVSFQPLFGFVPVVYSILWVFWVPWDRLGRRISRG